MRICVIRLAVAVVLLAPAAGFAQQKGNAGLTMGYPAAVGGVWHMSNDIALRPELSISRSSSESTSGLGGTSGWSIGIGGSALFYLTRDGDLRTYVSPRYVYARSRTSSANVGILPITSEATSSTSTLNVSYGAQYAISPRFSAFGEVGVGYAWGSVRTSFSGLRSESDTWSTRTGAGVILYF